MLAACIGYSECLISFEISTERIESTNDKSKETLPITSSFQGHWLSSMNTRAMSSESEDEEFYDAEEKFGATTKSHTAVSFLRNTKEQLNEIKTKVQGNEKQCHRVVNASGMPTEQSSITSSDGISITYKPISLIKQFNSSSNKQDLPIVVSFDKSDLNLDEKNNVSIDPGSSSELYVNDNFQVMLPEPDLVACTRNQHEEGKPVPPPRKKRKNKPQGGKKESAKTTSVSTLSEEPPISSTTNQSIAEEFPLCLDVNKATPVQSPGKKCGVAKSEGFEEDNAENTSNACFNKEVDSDGESDGSVKQMNMVMRTRTQSGRRLTDQEILQQVTVLNLDTGEQIPLSLAEKCLPKCIDPLSIYIMRLTAEYSLRANGMMSTESVDDVDLKTNTVCKTQDNGKIHKKTSKIKKLIGKTVGKTIKKMKTVAEEVAHSRHSEEVDISEEEMSSDASTDIKFKVSKHNCNRPYEFEDVHVLQELNTEHTDAVWIMKFSPCGRLLASAGQDATLKIWVLRNSYSDFDDIRKQYSSNTSPSSSQEHLSPPHVHDQSKPEASDISEDMNGPFMSKPFCTFEGHTSHLLDISWSENYFILSSSMDKTVRLWHIMAQTCLCYFQHPEFVTSVAFHPMNDSFFLSGSLDGKIRLWNVVKKRVVMSNQLDNDVKIITALSFSQEGKYAIVGTYDGRCIFYTMDPTKQLQYYTQIAVRSTRGKNSRGRKVTAIEPMPETNKILVTSNDSRIRLYDLRDFSLSCKYKGHINSSSQIRASFSHDGKYIISGSENKYMYIWKIRHGYKSSRSDRSDYWEGIKAHKSLVTVATFAPYPNLILANSDQAQHSNTTTEGYVIASAEFGGTIKVLANRTGL